VDWIPIGSVAKRSIFVERSVEFRPTGSISLGPGLQPAEFFSPRDRTANIRAYQLRDVVLDTGSMALFHGGKLLEEASAGLDRNTEFLRDAPQHGDFLVGEPAVVCCNAFWRDYFHWMTQSLPAIDWSLASAPQGSICLAVPPLCERQEEALGLLGYGRTPRVTLEVGRTYGLVDAWFSDVLSGDKPFMISGSTLSTLKRLSGAVSNHAPSYDLVYVATNEQHYGRLTNQHALQEVLARSGFHTIKLDGESISDQIVAFRNARVIISVHGSALTNIAFCSPGTLVWELFPSYYSNACYNRLAQAAGLDYWADVSSGDATCRTWEVDIDIVSSRLRDLNFWDCSTHVSHLPSRFWLSDHSDSRMDEAPRDLPLDDLIGEFENLGEDCEFGLVQRDAGANPLGLLRFAGFRVAPDARLAFAVAAIKRGFDGLDSSDAVTLELHGSGDRPREFMVFESRNLLLYHTFLYEGSIDPVRLQRQQQKVLSFLHRKFLSDLRLAPKIWVWKSQTVKNIKDINSLLGALCQRAPNKLLWVTYEDPDHAAGTVQQMSDSLVVGYVPKRPNPFEFDARAWHAVCRQTHNMFRSHNA
jgi:capsular polysaccharide biosynthesis protein